MSPILSAGALDTVFDWIKNGLNQYIQDATLSGFLLGIFLVVGFVLIVVMLMAVMKIDTKHSPPVLLLFAIGICIAVGVGWWPLWTVILIGIILVFIIVQPFGGRFAGSE